MAFLFSNFDQLVILENLSILEFALSGVEKVKSAQNTIIEICGF